MESMGRGEVVTAKISQSVEFLQGRYVELMGEVEARLLARREGLAHILQCPGRHTPACRNPGKPDLPRKSALGPSLQYPLFRPRHKLQGCLHVVTPVAENARHRLCCLAEIYFQQHSCCARLVDTHHLLRMTL